MQLSALGLKKITYHILIEKCVCNINQRDCMLQMCGKCPKKEGIKSFLMNITSASDHEHSFINYKQWVSTDRCQLIEVSEEFENFIESLSNKIQQLTRHHFIAKGQSAYLKDLKESINEEELVVLADYSENYSFIIQDAAQGFHWDNSQCTVHPFVIYYKNSKTSKIEHKSYCFISSVTNHDTIMFYSFLNKLIPSIRNDHPNLKKIHYFTDGCSAQYKNKYNFASICNHESYYGISCEWNFFATSHGKSACDGNSGTVKRAVAKASLQRPTKNLILTVTDMFKFCTEDLGSQIKFFLTSPEEIVKT